MFRWYITAQRVWNNVSHTMFNDCIYITPESLKFNAAPEDMGYG